jgi:site-specific DNA recombinase
MSETKQPVILVRDLGERNIKTKFKMLSTGKTRGGISFGRGSLYHLLSNHFYIGEVKYRNEILPGEQPPILDRALFDAVRQKALAQWSHRTLARGESDHLLAGLIFDDAGHRMVPTHATKASIRYRYYASVPVLHGQAKIATVGSVSRVPAAEVEHAVIKSVNDHLSEQKVSLPHDTTRTDDRATIAQLISAVTVHNNKLIVRLKLDKPDEASDNSNDQSLTIPW